MKVVGRNVVDEFGQNHADVLSQVKYWLCEAESAEWRSPKDIKQRYPHASILSKNRVIFNLKGNKYRLEAKINYAAGVVLIKRMGTHAEYSKWDL
jgi:mRNA interferase HigB